MDTMWSIDAMEYQPHLKTKTIPTHATTRLNLEDICSVKRSESQKGKCFAIPPVCVVPGLVPVTGTAWNGGHLGPCGGAEGVSVQWGQSSRLRG